MPRKSTGFNYNKYNVSELMQLADQRDITIPFKSKKIDIINLLKENDLENVSDDDTLNDEEKNTGNDSDSTTESSDTEYLPQNDFLDNNYSGKYIKSVEIKNVDEIHIKLKLKNGYVTVKLKNNINSDEKIDGVITNYSHYNNDAYSEDFINSISRIKKSKLISILKGPENILLNSYDEIYSMIFLITSIGTIPLFYLTRFDEHVGDIDIEYL